MLTIYPYYSIVLKIDQLSIFFLYFLYILSILIAFVLFIHFCLLFVVILIIFLLIILLVYLSSVIQHDSCNIELFPCFIIFPLILCYLLRPALFPLYQLFFLFALFLMSCYVMYVFVVWDSLLLFFLLNCLCPLGLLLILILIDICKFLFVLYYLNIFNQFVIVLDLKLSFGLIEYHIILIFIVYGYFLCSLFHFYLFVDVLVLF